MDASKVKSLPVQSKRYITKVMFLVAVAKPVYDDYGACVFDGKVGCWRVADIDKRNRNYNGKRTKYVKGDLYVKDVSMGAVKYVQMLTDLLLPRLIEIKETIWGECQVRVQHDGAPGHRAEGIEMRLTSLFASINAIFIRQPPKSPCSNMLDMAVFHSLSTIVAQTDYETKDELVAAVMDAWAILPVSTLDMEWACKASTSFTPF